MGEETKIQWADDWLDDEVAIGWFLDFIRLIWQTPNLDWLLLTKRPENFFKRLEACLNLFPTPRIEDAGLTSWLINWVEGQPPQNVWIGTSIEDQKAADERIPLLLPIPAWVRFLSVEPMLGPVDLSRPFGGPTLNRLSGIHWVIVGGESGHAARPCDVRWMRNTIDQCRTAGVACFVKQLGGWVISPIDSIIDPRTEWPHSTEMGACQTLHKSNLLRVLLKDRKGGDPSEWPEDLRVREFPQLN